MKSLSATLGAKNSARIRRDNNGSATVQAQFDLNSLHRFHLISIVCFFIPIFILALGLRKIGQFNQNGSN